MHSSTNKSVAVIKMQISLHLLNIELKLGGRRSYLEMRDFTPPPIPPPLVISSII